ncbi:MAG TPA: hypothetical protein VNI60_02250 [Pyrinomonadaceae bacterium]|nr:hypothetical protein [Pyrinomonadaceae bacterium]
MRFSIFLFEVMDKMPTFEYMYVSGIILSLLVFAATYFHRQVGLISLLLVSLLCVQDIETPDIVDLAIKEAGQNYIAHWNLSCRMTFILSVILFFTAIILKRKLKQKNKLD